jgi:outer membrane protein OmpA-like peptidoglycan-associated protein
VRVVGYTDGLGGLERNSPLSQSRADKVAADLRTKGAPVEKIVVLGRAFSVDISSDLGPGSPNRRVEFEVGFDGESARSGPGQ